MSLCTVTSTRHRIHGSIHLSYRPQYTRHTHPQPLFFLSFLSHHSHIPCSRTTSSKLNLPSTRVHIFKSIYPSIQSHENIQLRPSCHLPCPGIKQHLIQNLTTNKQHQDMSSKSHRSDETFDSTPGPGQVFRFITSSQPI